MAASPSTPCRSSRTCWTSTRWKCTAWCRFTASSTPSPRAGSSSACAARSPAIWQARTRVARQLENDLGISFGETTPDGKFTLEWANCIGMCDQGPALLVNDKVYTRVTPDKVHEILEECRQRVRRVRHAHRRATNMQQTHTGPLTFSQVAPARAWPRRLKKSRSEIIGELGDSGAERPRRRRLPDRREVEPGGGGARRAASTSSATPTKASPARSRTASSSPSTPTWSSTA